MNETGGRVIVTGGSGLIGRPLVDGLAADGHEVIVLSRAPERVDRLPAGARAVGWDAESADGWGELADGAGGIVHLAGESLADWPWSDEKKRAIRDSRVRSSLAVLEAIRRAAVAPRVLLQASGVNYYGDTGDRVIDEEEPPGEGFLPEVCVEWEASTEEVEQRGVRRALLRTAMVLSTEGGALPKLALPFKLFVGGPTGRGDHWMPWIHRTDQVAAIRFLLADEAAAGPFNLAAPQPVTNRELSRQLAHALRRPGWFPVPKTALRLALGEMADMLLVSLRVVPGRLENLGFRFRFPTLTQALADLYGR
ncbi:MAG TPA: TIGR01777 family oxidoreductase [Thermoanaerobaculia bacterium]|nr:TIGR01777 family oxidoreductase [Thermoanaerobaculia bacterium]